MKTTTGSLAFNRYISSRRGVRKPRRPQKDNHIRGEARFATQTPEQRLHVACFNQSVLPAVCGAGYQCQNHERESGRRLWAECVTLSVTRVNHSPAQTASALYPTGG